MSWPEIELQFPGPLVNTLPLCRIIISIRLEYLKPYNCVQIICITNGYCCIAEEARKDIICKKKYKSLLYLLKGRNGCKCVCLFEREREREIEREREREREDCCDWQFVEMNIFKALLILASLTDALIQSHDHYRGSTCPTFYGLMCLLTGCFSNDWPLNSLELKIFCTVDFLDADTFFRLAQFTRFISAISFY